MVRYTITPWKHHSDLLTVRQQLYRVGNSSDANPSDAAPPDLRRHAVDRIMAWKLRSNLPHAVESTALLIDAQLHHQTAVATSTATSAIPSGEPGISDFSIRAVYAAAFTRFVTGFCDIGRSRERGGGLGEQSSMLAIARQIGMPVEFVGLRHEAVHEELPGLRRLVRAVNEALGWLWSVYWEGLEERGGDGAVAGVESATGTRVEVGRLLKGFRRGKREVLKAGGPAAKKSGKELVKRTVEQCVALCDSSQAAADVIADVFINERLLLPTNRALGEDMTGAYLIWDDLVAKMLRTIPTLATALLQSLVTRITQVGDAPPHNDGDKQAYALWVIHLSQTSAVIQADAIMQGCCLHPGHWTAAIGKELLRSQDESFGEEWEDVFAASLLNGEGDGVRPASTPPQSDEMIVDDVPEAPQGRWTRAILPPTLPIGVVS